MISIKHISSDKVSKIYNGKIEVVSFVIDPGWKITIGVKFKINSRNQTFFVVSLISSSIPYINGIQLAKFVIFLDRTLSNILICDLSL